MLVTSAKRIPFLSLRAITNAPMASPESAAQESAAQESAAAPSSTASTSQLRKSKKQETKKRRVLTLEDKYELLKLIGNGEKQSVVAKRFDPPLSESTTSTIMKGKDDIVRAFEGEYLYKEKRKNMKHSTFPDLEKVLSEWFRKVQAMNISVSTPLLQEKAQHFAEHLGHENFKTSNGSLDKFKERHGITGQPVCGEEKSVFQIFAEATVRKIASMLMKLDLCGKLPRLRHLT